MSPVWLSEITKQERIPVETFCEGRKKKVAYTLFYKRFVPAVVGPELFRQRVRDSTAVALSTASDEAFTLLLLENSYARWVSIFDKNGGMPSQRRGDTKRTFDSDIEAKYTRGGIKLSHDKESQKRKGWTHDGIKRFNTLFAFVRKDKLKRPKFDARCNKQLRESLEQSNGSKKRRCETIVATHSLWEEEQTPEPANDDDSSSSSSGGTII